MALSPRQQVFAEQYAATGEASKSAIAAGYSPQSARAQGTRLLQNAEVKSLIVDLRAVVRKKSTVDAAWVLQELAGLAQVDLLDLFTERGDLRAIDQMPEQARRLISGIEVEAQYDKDGELTGYLRKIKLTDRVRLLELIGKHKAIDAWRTPDVTVNLPTLVVRNYTGRALPEQEQGVIGDGQEAIDQ